MATSNLYETIQNTINRFISSYPAAVAQSHPSILSQSLSPDCFRQYAPVNYVSSKGYDPETYGFSNAAYEEHMRGELTHFEAIEMKVLDTCIDEGKRKAWVWAQHHTKFKAGNGKDKGMVQVMECIWMLDLNESGSEVVKLRQFLDTVATESFIKMYEGKKA